MKVAKQWKSGGSEDKAIKKLIKEGKVRKNTKPSYLQTEHPQMFKDFSIGVIRNHLTDVKRQCGLFVGDDVGSDDDQQNFQDDWTLKEEAEYVESLRSSSSSNDIMVGFNKMVHQNYPIICKTYTDPETESEKVLVVVSLPGGADQVKIDFAENGMSVTIKYQWSKTMYDVSDLFKKQLDSNELSSQHALISCYKAGLAEVRKKINVAPVSAIKFDLPIQVQKIKGSWKRWGVMRDDGTQVLTMTFTGLVKEYEIVDMDEPVKFEK